MVARLNNFLVSIDATTLLVLIDVVALVVLIVLGLLFNSYQVFVKTYINQRRAESTVKKQDQHDHDPANIVRRLDELHISRFAPQITNRARDIEIRHKEPQSLSGKKLPIRHQQSRKKKDET